jgi:CBS domain containing-hemolysin-like protein
MDTDDVPLSLLLQSGIAEITPHAAVFAVLGVLLCLIAAVTAYAAVVARIGRGNIRKRGTRAAVGALMATVAAALLLWLGLQWMAVGPGLTGQLGRMGLAFGAALLLPCLAMLLAAGRATIDSAGSRVVRAGNLVADTFAGWLPLSSNGNGVVHEFDTPEFEITMASGEEVEAEEREYIENILELGETTAHEVMTPRTDVVALDVGWEPEQILDAVAGARFSRFPVYEENIDTIVGILHLRDLLEFMARGEGVSRLDLRSILNEPFFVPASKKIDDVLRELQTRQGHMAVVLDEYGGTAGILTIEDLLEEIVGEIQDEYDDESKLVYQRDDGAWVVDGQLPLDDLASELSISIEAEDVDTLGGLVSHLLGHIPVPRESVVRDGLRFTVLSMEKNRVSRVLLERLSLAERGSATAGGQNG